MNKKSWLEKRKMTLEELNIYYRELRKELYEKNEPVKGIELRKKLHKLMNEIVNIEKIIENFSINIIEDESIKASKPRIYAVTHIGRFDIEAIIQAAKEAAYFVWGDPGNLYRSPEILFINMVGAIFVDTNDKEDRHISLETMVKILKQEGNIIIYPEGAWNITENEIVMKLYTGVIEAAIRGNADIIPVAIEKDDSNKYYVKLGKNIDSSTMSIENKREEADNLRSIMASLKWDIWKYLEKKNGITKRSELPWNASEQYKNSIMKDSGNDYTVEEIERTRFIDKSEITPEEAFKHLTQIKVTKENAFLFENMTKEERKRQGKLLIKSRQNDIL